MASRNQNSARKDAMRESVSTVEGTAERGNVDALASADVKVSDTNTDSNRVVLTKKTIVQALMDLMAKTDLSKISVKDIQARAGVSRATFYRCFRDKYDVINWSFKRFKQIMMHRNDQFFSFRTSLRVQLEYIEAHREYFAKAFRYTGQNSLRDYAYETNCEYMFECWQYAHPGKTPDFETTAAIQFAAAGFVKIIEEWVASGCAEERDHVIDVVDEMLPPMAKQDLF